MRDGKYMTSEIEGRGISRRTGLVGDAMREEGGYFTNEVPQKILLTS